MSFIQAIILGIIQGLTEFLPISSTAHLTLAAKYMGVIDPANSHIWTANMAIIQLGTLFAVLIYFYKDIISIPKPFFVENFGQNRKQYSAQSFYSKLGWFIILGSIPIGIFGLGLKDIIEGSITKESSVIAFSLIFFAIILFIAEKSAKHKRTMENLNWKDAIIVGLGQCIALIPGASRSGVTITTGLFLGMKRETAARFSFLLSIPAVFMSGLYEFYKSFNYITYNDVLMLIIATIIAGISGYLTIAFLLNFLKTKSTTIFVIYRIVLGIIIFIQLF